MVPPAASTITARVVSDPGAELDNTATVDATSTDDNPDNDSDDEVTPITSPVIELDKDVSGDGDDDDARNTDPGDDYTFSVKVTNTGTSPAYDVVVTDQPDAELTNVVVATDPDWTVDDGWTVGDPDIRWTIPGPIAPDETVTLTYTADLVGSGSLSQDDTVVNTADVTSYYGTSEQDRTDDPSDEYPEYTEVVDDTVTMTVKVPAVDLEKTTGTGGFPDDAPAKIEESFPWRIVITNTNAGSGLIGVDLTDTLPKNWTYTAGSAQISGTGSLTPGGQIEPSIATDPGGDVLTWTDLGDLAGGETLIIDFEATPGTDAAFDPGVNNAQLNDAAAVGEDASGATESADGPYADDDDAIATLQQPEADIAVVKKADDPTPIAGTETTWTIEVTNNGPETAPGVKLSDPIPAGVSYVDAVPDQGTCQLDTGALECDLGAISSGSTVTITLTTLVGADQAGETIVNEATVSDPTINDTNPGNDTDDDSVAPRGEADLAISKDLLTDLIIGETGTYELTVTNAGPSVAEAATVVDQLPDGLVFKQARGADCNGIGGGRVRCDLGDLEPGAVVVIEIDVEVGGSGGEVTNTATVDSDTDDPNEGNNTDDQTALAGNADLAIDKTGPAPIVEGTVRGYVLEVSNVGDIASSGTVTVTDQIPDGLEVLKAFGNGWVCEIEGSLVTCSRDDSLQPGASFPEIRIRVTPVEDAPFEIVTNSGVVSLPGDPNPGNDTDSVDTPIGPEAEVDENVIAGKCSDGSLRISPSFVWVGERTKVTVRVEDENGNAAVNVPVVLRGKGAARKYKETDRTDKTGRAIFKVKAKGKNSKWVASVAVCDLKDRLKAKRQDSCRTLTARPRSIPVGVRSRVRVKLRAPDGSPLRGVKVKITGQGTSDSARTNKRGKAKLFAEPNGAGLLKITARKATSCKLKIGVTAGADGGQLTG